MRQAVMVSLYAAMCWCLGDMAGTCLKVPSVEQVVAVEKWAVVEVWPNRALLDALAFVESSNNPRAVSPAGARGLYQLMEPAWRQVMTEPYSEAFNPQLCELAAVRYLEWIKTTLTTWRGFAPDVIDILSCWHGGIGRYKRRGYDLAKMPKSTQQFVVRVVTRMRIHEN